MRREPVFAISHALGIARACWQLANDAVNDGHLPEASAAGMAKSAREAAVLVEETMADVGHRLPPELFNTLRSGAIDLETVSELGSLITKYELTPKNALHLAHAVRYTAASAVGFLSRAEDGLMVARH